MNSSDLSPEQIAHLTGTSDVDEQKAWFKEQGVPLLNLDTKVISVTASELPSGLGSYLKPASHEYCPEPQLQNSHQTILYRHYSKSKLLYVGISLSVLERICQHKFNSKWFNQVDRITLERFKDREAAMKAERIAIKTEKPKYNVIHNE